MRRRAHDGSALPVVTLRLFATRGFAATRAKPAPAARRLGFSPRSAPSALLTTAPRFLLLRFACSPRAASLRLGQNPPPLRGGWAFSLASLHPRCSRRLSASCSTRHGQRLGQAPDAGDRLFTAELAVHRPGHGLVAGERNVPCGKPYHGPALLHLQGG